MIAEFRLPDLGEGLPEAEIVQWLVARGDEVTLNQPIAEVETAKAIVELPSPFAGTVSDLHAAAGDVVAVGAPLIAIDVPGDAGAPAGAGEAGSADQAGVTRETAADTAAAAADTDATVPNLVGYGAAPRTAGRPQRRARAVRAAAASASASDTAVLADAPHDVVAPAPTEDLRHERPRSTPPVRAYAKERGVDLALVEASGVTGIIRREDVDRYADAMRAQAAGAPATAAPTAPGTPGARETRIPIRGVRKHTAASMVQSAFTAPHVTTFLEVDVTETVRLVADLRADRRLDGHRIGILAVAAKAACLALRAEPSLNARWDGPAGEIVQFHYVNLGIAAATERGLVVPHIADADRLTLVELADAIGALAQTARSGRTAPGALSAAPSRSPTSACSASMRERRSSIRERPASSASGRCADARGNTTARSSCATSRR